MKCLFCERKKRKEQSGVSLVLPLNLGWLLDSLRSGTERLWALPATLPVWAVSWYFVCFSKAGGDAKGDAGSVWQVSSQKGAEGALYYGKTRVGSVSLVSGWNESKNFVFWKLVGAFFKSKRGSFWTAHSLDHSKKCLTTTHETKRSRHLPELHENLPLILEHWIFFGKI